MRTKKKRLAYIALGFLLVGLCVVSEGYIFIFGCVFEENVLGGYNIRIFWPVVLMGVGAFGVMLIGANWKPQKP